MFELKLTRCYVTVAILVLAGSTVAQTRSTHPLTIENLIEIRHPSNPIWSPDGQRIAFLWDRADIVNLYVVNADGGSKPTALTSFRDGKVAGAFWSKDGSAIYFARGGNLWLVPVAGGEPHAVWTTPGPEMEFSLSPDGTKLAFVRAGSQGEAQHGGDLIVRSLSDGSESKITHDNESIYSPLWSPDGSQLACLGGSKIISHDESPAYSGEKLIYAVFEYTNGQLYVVPASGGKATAIDSPGEYNGLAWTDSAHLTYDRQSNAYKRRTIYVASATGGAPKAIHEDKEDKFWSLPDWEAEAKPKPSPDGKWIAFLTDLDGWDQLYVISAGGGDAVQITKGHFEAWRPAWSHDGTRIAFDANEPDHPGDRRVGIVTLGNDPTHPSVTYITTGRGTNVAPSWSPEDKRLVYQHTDTQNSADLFSIAAASGAKPVRLSESMPAGIDHSAFVEPQFVHYPGPDGQSVPGWLFVPKNLDHSKKHPAIIWVHGDGINQNYDGWHIQRNYAVYYSYHQYLLQQGYVVFAPDYRGSIGYGRDWRNGVYMDVGGNDAKDAWMGANYLKTLPYVDSDRIGIWGLSYGGFFTLIAITDQPKLFRAAVDVAGVADYEMYYHDPYNNDWTEGRMGRPEQNPKIYANEQYANRTKEQEALVTPLVRTKALKSFGRAIDGWLPPVGTGHSGSASYRGVFSTGVWARSPTPHRPPPVPARLPRPRAVWLWFL